MSDGGVSIQAAMNVAALGILFGSLAFSWLGIHLERDWFLMMGLLACCLGNVAFSAYLWEQGVAGERRDAMVALFGCCFLLTLYATYCQCVEWHEEGWVAEEGEEGEEGGEGGAGGKAAARGGGGGGGGATEEEGEEGEEEEEEEGAEGGAAANVGLAGRSGLRRR